MDFSILSDNRKTVGTMKEDYLVHQIAKNSLNHRHESRFLQWLESVAKDDLNIEPIDATCNDWEPVEWRDRIIKRDAILTSDVLDHFDNELLDNFTTEDCGELIASVGYDHYGPAHSGWNAVYEFCGVYVLSGSDFDDGPTEELDVLLDQLDFDNPEHEVFRSKYAD